jgi:hypothetical protein
MIRLKTYKYGYFKILLLTFSINIVLQPCLGQNLNDGAQEGESDQESQLPGAEEPDSLSPAQPDSIDSALGQNLNDGAQDGESDQESQLPGAKEPGSLSPAQPDSIDNAALMKKRMFYGIAVAVPIYLLLSQDEGRDASVSKVGPPPDWPNN